MSRTEAEKKSAMPTRPATANDLPEHAKTWMSQQNPSPVFTMNKEEAAHYLGEFGFPTNRAAVVRAVYNGQLVSRLVGKKRLISQHDALVYALSGGEHFGLEASA